MSALARVFLCSRVPSNHLEAAHYPFSLYSVLCTRIAVSLLPLTLLDPARYVDLPHVPHVPHVPHMFLGSKVEALRHLREVRAAVRPSLSFRGELRGAEQPSLLRRFPFLRGPGERQQPSLRLSFLPFGAFDTLLTPPCSHSNLQTAV